MNFIGRIIERLKESKSAKSMPIRVWKVVNGETTEMEWDGEKWIPVGDDTKGVTWHTTDLDV